MRYSTSSVLITTLAATAFLIGCDAPNDPVGVDDGDVPAFGVTNAGAAATATGGGQFDAGIPTPVTFSFSAIQHTDDGSADGNMRFSTEFGGLAIEFHGRVTCMTSDLANGRAWIGGVITRNDSEHPFWSQDINEPGDAIWFRVVDYGEGSRAVQVDRSTFVGFEGNGGIITSAEYCETQPWPDGDARTNPLTDGDIQVRG